MPYLRFGGPAAPAETEAEEQAERVVMVRAEGDMEQPPLSSSQEIHTRFWLEEAALTHPSPRGRPIRLMFWLALMAVLEEPQELAHLLHLERGLALQPRPRGKTDLVPHC